MIVTTFRTMIPAVGLVLRLTCGAARGGGVDDFPRRRLIGQETTPDGGNALTFALESLPKRLPWERPEIVYRSFPGQLLMALRNREDYRPEFDFFLKLRLNASSTAGWILPTTCDWVVKFPEMLRLSGVDDSPEIEWLESPHLKSRADSRERRLTE
jgi:hypothetical protein